MRTLIAAVSAGCVLSVAGLLIAGTQTIDGVNIDAATWGVGPVAVQDTDTGFGDYPGDNRGNELDQMFVDADSDNLYIGLSGNLGDDNAMTIFIDTDPGPTAAVTLDSGDPNDCPQGELPIVVAVLDNTVFDPNFAPDYAMLISVGKFPGQSDTQLVLAADLMNLNALTNEALGIGAVNSGNGIMTGAQGVEIAIDGTNDKGVKAWDDSSTPGMDITEPNRPGSATKGIEISIPRSMLGLTGGAQDIRVFAYITNNVPDTGDWVIDPNNGITEYGGPCDRRGYGSNQALPGLGGNNNLASFSPKGYYLLDFSGGQGPGIQYVTVTIPAP